jgi:predicted nucleic acid-binding protein
VSLLLDTSVWVEYLRDTGSPASAEVARLLHEDLEQVATTPPVVMELLAGATDDAALLALEQLAAGLPALAVDPALDFASAAAVHRAARRRGRTVRGLLDCLLAAIAARHDAVVVHRDADLALACAVVGVQQRDLR